METEQSQFPQFKLDAFEGPLDLLLHLIKKNKIDIWDIPVAEITKQYMRAITPTALRILDLDLAGEYLLMASTLTQIKSRMLLPIEEDEMDDADSDFEKDPRAALVKKLLEYQKFKEAAGNLARLPKFSMETFKPGYKEMAPIELGDNEVSSENVDIFTLLAFFDKLMQKLPEEDPHEIEEEGTTVSEKIKSIIEYLSAHEGKRIPISEMFTVRSRPEIIVTFLSILELTRLKYILIYQAAPDSEIWIRKNFTNEEIDLDTLSSIEDRYSSRAFKEEKSEEEEYREHSE